MTGGGTQSLTGVCLVALHQSLQICMLWHLGDTDLSLKQKAIFQDDNM